MSTVTNYISTFDTAYPIAGSNNNSQGFRDNFKAIKFAFTATQNEINDLQANTARTDQTSNFNTNTILNANFQNYSITSVKPDDGITDVDYKQGSFYSLTIAENTNATVNIINLPTTTDNDEARSGVLVISITATGSDPSSVQFAAAGYTVVNLGPSNQPFSIIGDNRNIIVEIWSESSDKILYVKKQTHSIYDFANTATNLVGITGSLTQTLFVGESITLKETTATISTVLGSKGAVIVNDDIQWGQVGVLPYTVYAEVSDRIVHPVGGLGDMIKLLSTSTLTTATNNTTTLWCATTANIKVGMVVSGFTGLGGYNNRPTVTQILANNRVNVSSKTDLAWSSRRLDFRDPAWFEIKRGAKVYFNGTDTQYIVNTSTYDSNDGAMLRFTQQFRGIDVAKGNILTFRNPEYINLPVIATMSKSPTPKYPVGSIWADKNNFQVIFEERTSTNVVNYFRISNIMVESLNVGPGLSINTTTGAVIMTNTGVIKLLNLTTATTSSGIIVSNSTGSIFISPQYGYNGYGKRWISTSRPNTDNSEGQDGDLWYRI